MKNKCQIVVIPTEELSDFVLISKGPVKGKILKREYYCTANTSMGDRYVNIHIITDEELKEGDWCCNIVSNTVFKACKDLIATINDPKVTLVTNKKIIATTDASMYPNYDGACGSECVCTIAKIPESFINHFIQVYNCGHQLKDLTQIGLDLETNTIELKWKETFKQVECTSEEGVTIGLIDSIMTQAAVLNTRDLSSHDVKEALKDLRANKNLKFLLNL
jgi:hypothetical protein